MPSPSPLQDQADRFLSEPFPLYVPEEKLRQQERRPKVIRDSSTPRSKLKVKLPLDVVKRKYQTRRHVSRIERLPKQRPKTAKERRNSILNQQIRDSFSIASKVRVGHRLPDAIVDFHNKSRQSSHSTRRSVATEQVLKMKERKKKWLSKQRIKRRDVAEATYRLELAQKKRAKENNLKAEIDEILDKEEEEKKRKEIESNTDVDDEEEQDLQKLKSPIISSSKKKVKTPIVSASKKKVKTPLVSRTKKIVKVKTPSIVSRTKNIVKVKANIANITTGKAKIPGLVHTDKEKQTKLSSKLPFTKKSVLLNPVSSSPQQLLARAKMLETRRQRRLCAQICQNCGMCIFCMGTNAIVKRSKAKAQTSTSLDYSTSVNNDDENMDGTSISAPIQIQSLDDDEDDRDDDTIAECDKPSHPRELKEKSSVQLKSLPGMRSSQIGGTVICYRNKVALESPLSRLKFLCVGKTKPRYYGAEFIILNADDPRHDGPVRYGDRVLFQLCDKMFLLSTGIKSRLHNDDDDYIFSKHPEFSESDESEEEDGISNGKKARVDRSTKLCATFHNGDKKMKKMKKQRNGKKIDKLAFSLPDRRNIPNESVWYLLPPKDAMDSRKGKKKEKRQICHFSKVGISQQWIEIRQFPLPPHQAALYKIGDVGVGEYDIENGMYAHETTGKWRIWLLSGGKKKKSKFENAYKQLYNSQKNREVHGNFGKRIYTQVLDFEDNVEEKYLESQKHRNRQNLGTYLSSRAGWRNSIMNDDEILDRYLEKERVMRKQKKRV
eukprot:g2129.t1